MNPITCMSGIQKDPGVCGGEACIRNTDTPWPASFNGETWGYRTRGILVHHPDLTAADLEAAWSYYRQHAEEIDQAIRRDEES